MTHPALAAHPRIDEGYRLIAHLRDIHVALSEAEYDIATILSFDPEAQLPAGALAGGPDMTTAACDTPHFGFPGARLDLSAWRRLARACVPGADILDDATCLAAFLAERANPEATVS